MPRKKTVDGPATAPALTAVPRPRVRSAKPKTTAQSAVSTSSPSYHEEIAEAAYLRFLSRGGGHGSDVDDWIEAEREVAHRHGFAMAG